MAVKRHRATLTTQPRQPVPVSPYWISRGLVFISLGNGLFWSKNGGWSGVSSLVGLPKNATSKHGITKGFGATSGTGTTDRIATGVLVPYSTGFRSIVSHRYANTTGGGGFGRIFNPAGSNGISANDECMFPNSATNGMMYSKAGAAAWQWAPTSVLSASVWACDGVTHDQRSTGITPVMYLDGVSVAVTAFAAGSGSYPTIGGFTLDLGNRSTDSARIWDGMLGPLLIFDHPTQGLTADEHAKLATNAYQVLLGRLTRRTAAEGGSFTGNQTDALALADSASNIASLTKSNSEALPLAESASVSGAFGVTATDALGLGHTQDAVVGFAVSNTEVLSLADSQNIGQNFAVSATDALSLNSSQSQLTISGAFERSSVNIASSTVVGAGDSAVFSFAPKLHTNESIGAAKWMEPSIEVGGVNGFRPTFRFLNYLNGTNGFHGYPWASTRRPMYSLDDGETWTYFDAAATIDTGNQWVEFRLSTAFTQNKIRISRSRQVSVHKAGSWLASLSGTYSFLEPTPAAVAYSPTGSVSDYAAQSFIADEFSAQTDSLGGAVPITPFYAAQINDTSLMPADGTAKRVAMVLSGVHGGEDHGNYHLIAMVEYLCGSSAQAQALRRQYRILIYPMMNAPGRAGGSFRGSWTTGTGGADDLNRHFHETGSALQTVDKPKAVMNTDRAGIMFDWVFDFHGTYLDDWSMFVDAGDPYHALFKTQFEAEVGYSIGVEGSSITGMVPFTWRGLGTRLAVTHESGDNTQISDAQIAGNAQAVVRALDNMRANGDLFPAGAVSEPLPLASAQDAMIGLISTISEAVTLTDTASASQAGNFSASQTEAASLGDSSSNTAAVSGTISEGMALSHTQAAQYAATASATDNLNLGATEASSAPGQYAVTATDALSLAHAQSSQAALSAALTDALALDSNASGAWMAFVALVEAANLNASQNGGVGVGVNASISEAMSLADSASQAFSATMSTSSWWSYQVPAQSLAYSVNISINA
jgi:hypothetical protein